MTFKEYFLLEKTDPDELYRIRNVRVITFALVPNVGYLYTYNSTVDGEYMQVSHTAMYSQLPGTLVGKNKLKVSNGLLPRYTQFMLLPGRTFTDMLTAIRKPIESRVLEGRLYKSSIAFWCALKTFTELNNDLLEKMLGELGVNPEELIYNFANISDISHEQVYNQDTVVDKDREAELELLRQIHLNPDVKKTAIPANTKLADIARQRGFSNIAQMRNQTVVGDSVNS
jgi:hypothetical protein